MELTRKGRVVVCLVGSALAIGAQTHRRFEVASVKAHKTGGDSSDRKILPGGRFVGSNVSVRTMLRIALLTEDSLMQGAPSWIDAETYDIDAKTGDGREIVGEQLPELMLGLLEERFQFRYHRLPKESPVYWLTVAKGGPKLKTHEAGVEPSMSTNPRGPEMVLKVTGASMADVAGALKRQAGRAVEDHTGLTGQYDFELVWARDTLPDAAGPSLFTAIQEQLGLKLTAAKGSVDVMVIDHIERPSAN